MNKNIKKSIISLMLASFFVFTSITAEARTLYHVIAGSYSVYSNAQKQLASVKSLGYKDAYITAYNGNYRINIGAFENKNNANNFVKTASKKGLSTFIFTETTKDNLYRVTAERFFTNKNDATKTLNLVKSKGYSDAYIANENGVYVVYIGSFKNLDNAYAFEKKAKQKGINAFVLGDYSY